MKIKDVLVLKEVNDDLNNGGVFYNQIQEGVGNYFRDSLIADIESLIIYAGIHPMTFSYYRLLAKRFPYAIYYEIENEIVYIIAVLPMRRDPIWIKKKLKHRNRI